MPGENQDQYDMQYGLNYRKRDNVSRHMKPCKFFARKDYVLGDLKNGKYFLVEI